jgi:hypothetical protein
MIIKEEIIISEKGKDTIWMTYTTNGTNKILFSDRKKELGFIDFGSDEDMCEGIFKYLGKRLTKLNFNKIIGWINILTLMTGEEVFFYLTVNGNTIDLKTLKFTVERNGYHVTKTGINFLVAKTEDGAYIGEFMKTGVNKYKFEYFI